VEPTQRRLTHDPLNKIFEVVFSRSHSAAVGFSAGWLRISATSQRLRNRADDKGCTLAAQCAANHSRIM
jgi:hypothetical protein